MDDRLGLTLETRAARISRRGADMSMWGDRRNGEIRAQTTATSGYHDRSMWLVQDVNQAV